MVVIYEIAYRIARYSYEPSSTVAAQYVWLVMFCGFGLVGIFVLAAAVIINLEWRATKQISLFWLRNIFMIFGGLCILCMGAAPYAVGLGFWYTRDRWNWLFPMRSPFQGLYCTAGFIGAVIFLLFTMMAWSFNVEIIGAKDAPTSSSNT